MKRIFRSQILLAVGMAVILAGCSPSTPPTISITNPMVPLGQTQSIAINQNNGDRLNWGLFQLDSTGKLVACTSACGTITSATGGTVTGTTSGTINSFPPNATTAAPVVLVYTAPNVLPAQPVVQFSVDDPGVPHGNVTDPITIVSNVTLSVLPKSSVVAVNQQVPFTATLTNDPGALGVTWSLGAGCTGATCGTISATSSASGTPITYTAPGSIPSSGTVSLTATSVADTSKTYAAAITFTSVLTVGVSPSTAIVPVGTGNQAFTATVSNDPSNKGVNWTLSGAGCTGAACGSLSASSSASGTPITYNAPPNQPTPNVVTITATSVADGKTNGTAQITIRPALSVTLSQNSATLQAGLGILTFTAMVTNDINSMGVTWTLSGTGCSGATCGNLSASSSTAVTYTAPAAQPSPATVTLTATAAADGKTNATAIITITPPVAVTISPSTATVQAEAGSQPFTPTVTFDAGTKGVTWTLISTGTDCTAVGNLCGSVPVSSASGTQITYTPPAIVPSSPTVTLTATSVTDTTKSASAVITLTAPPAIVLTVAPGTANVPTGTSAQFIGDDKQHGQSGYQLGRFRRRVCGRELRERFPYQQYIGGNGYVCGAYQRANSEHGHAHGDFGHLWDDCRDWQTITITAAGAVYPRYLFEFNNDTTISSYAARRLHRTASFGDLPEPRHGSKRASCLPGATSEWQGFVRRAIREH